MARKISSRKLHLESKFSNVLTKAQLSRRKLRDLCRGSSLGTCELVESEGILPNELSSSYLGMSGLISPTDDGLNKPHYGLISLSQYKIARSARKRWLKSDCIRSIKDMDSLVRVVMIDGRLSLYRILSNSVINNVEVEESQLLVSGKLEDWFLRSFELEVGIPMVYCSVVVSRRYFCY